MYIKVLQLAVDSLTKFVSNDSVIPRNEMG